MKLYNELSEYYFAIESKHRNFDEDIRLIKSLLPGDAKSKILDLGCGTGEHLAFLARNGFQCVGLDSSIEMINTAKSRNNFNVSYIHKDIKEFDFFEEFDLIFSLFGSFNYILNDNEIDNSLWNIWRALKPHGKCLLEIWNADPLLTIEQKPLAHVSTTLFNGAKIDRKRGFKILENTTRTIVEVFYDYSIFGDNNYSDLKDKHIMRAYKQNEFDKFLTNNGFKILNTYSNSKKDHFHNNSNKQLIIFEKV